MVEKALKFRLMPHIPVISAIFGALTKIARHLKRCVCADSPDTAVKNADDKIDHNLIHLNLRHPKTIISPRMISNAVMNNLLKV
jgi:hypothetical protein